MNEINKENCDARCKFNLYVECNEDKCKNCGWNPVVAEQRTNKLRRYGCKALSNT